MEGNHEMANTSDSEIEMSKIQENISAMDQEIENVNKDSLKQVWNDTKRALRIMAEELSNAGKIR